MPIQVTLTFASEAELLAYFAGTKPAPAAKEAAAPKSKPAATGETTTKAATTSSPASPTTAPAAAQGANEGNVTPAATETASPSASSASSQTSEPAPEAVDFDTLKKAFLALSTKDGGRAKCEGVLKPHGLAKLSEAKPEQYAGILAAIQQASV